MLDLANILMKATEDSLEQKKIEMNNAKQEVKDLKNLPKDKRGDKTKHTQRVQEARDKLQESTDKC